MPSKYIAVACDFHPDSIHALSHAADFASKLGTGILLLHLVQDEAATSGSRASMEGWKSTLSQQFKGPIETVIEKGDVVEDLAKVADKNGAVLVIMPTHGMHGIQHFTGSLALHVVSETHLPFLVVQKRPARDTGYRKMVLPIDYRPQLADEAGLFIQIAAALGSEVHMVVNEKFKAERDASVLEAIKRRFEEAYIPMHIHQIKLFDFHQAVVEYAASIDADLICSVNFAYENLYTIMPRADEEELIYNKAQIPVLLITPLDQDDQLKYIPFLMGG
jgi:nucleotide-binding universal stress UspA family protein